MPIVANGTATRVDQDVPGEGINDTDPAITILADGGYAVAWRMTAPGGYNRTWARKFDAAGNPVADQVLIPSPPDASNNGFGYSHTYVAIARTAGGGFLVGFQDSGTSTIGNGIDYRLATFDAAGGLVSQSTPRPSSTQTDWMGDVAYNEGGAAHVAVWHTGAAGNRDLWINGSIALTNVFSNEVDIEDFGDGYIFLWSTGGVADTFIRVVRTGYSAANINVAADPAGSQFGGATDNNLAVGAGGGFAAVWSDGSNSIRARTWDAMAATTTVADIIITPTGGLNPEIVALPNGRYLVVWQDNDPALLAGIRAQQIAADGTLIGPRQTLVLGSTAQQPAVAARPDGSIILTWRDGFSIFTQRFDITADPTPQNDVLTGSASAELIDALAGDDSVSALAGDDTIIGGLGRDTLTGGSGADVFRLAANNHSLTATPDVITDFNSGEDKLDLGPLNLTGAAYVVVQQSASGSVVQIDADANGSFEQTVLFSTSVTGQDILAGVGVTVVAGAGVQTLIGTALNDALAAGDGNDQVAGRDGNDSLYGQGGNDVLYGQAGADFAYGGAGSDALIGDTGDDSLLGEDGDDSVFGQDGNDLLYGGEGADGVYGGIGADTQLGGGGNDAVLGEDGDDILFGEAGVDTVIGGGGNDLIFGGAEGDQLIGGAGTDTLVGEAGADTLFGEAGNDTIYGGADVDTLYGGADGDTLYGDGGNDTLLGEDGGDVLYGGTGGDILAGGFGGDLFLYLAVGDSTGAAADLITDFSTGQDVLSLTQIDANLIVAGDQAFTVVGTTGVLAAGQLRLTYDSVNNRTILEADNDGIAGADLVILLNGNVGPGAWLGL